MRFLRVKPRRVQAASMMGTSGEAEEEEGRQGLLSQASKHEQSSAYLHNYDHMLPGAVHASTVCQDPVKLNCKQQQAAPASTTQVVVLKAPLHCQGCARRVKKSLAKLPGVNTFHVDVDLQKVTVIGNMAPEDVLQSVNKVMKGAQFWAAPNMLTA